MKQERDRAWRRRQDWTKTNRKKNIAHRTGWYVEPGEEHRLSKGKIHCSCPMCSGKTKYNGLSKRDRISKQKGEMADVREADEWEE